MPLQIVIPVGTGATAGTGVTTYSRLVTTLGLWLNRSDLGDKIPDFITLFEARLNRILRTPEMDEIVELAVTDGAADLPTDFLEAQHLYADGEITPKPLSTFRTSFPVDNGTTPQVYAIANNQILIAPSGAETITLHYWQKIPALNADNETNWLIVSHPDVYLYGALVMAEAFIWDDQRIPLWKSALDEALGELKRQGVGKRYGGGPLHPRVASVA